MRSCDVHDRTIAVRDTPLKTPPKPVRRSGISPDDDSRNRAPAHLKEGMLGRRMQPTTPDWRSRKSTKVARRPGRFLPVAQVLQGRAKPGSVRSRERQWARVGDGPTSTPDVGSWRGLC